jgi:hypothetical protein
MFPLDDVTSPIGKAMLTLTPVAFPVSPSEIEIYGIASNVSHVSYDMLNQGVLLDTWTLGDLVLNGDFAHDVTEFLKGVETPFVGFRLKATDGLNSFSTRYTPRNHPSQLIVTLVPEPTVLALVATASALLMTRRSSRRQCRSAR